MAKNQKAIGSSVNAETDGDQTGTTTVENVAADFIPDGALGDWLTSLEFPVGVVLRNNGHFAHVEPVSCAFVEAGGAQTIVLHDIAHASRVVSNIVELNASHYGQEVKLLIDGAPDEIFRREVEAVAEVPAVKAED